MKFLDNKKGKATLNITPLVDVLFILIIFFVVSSTFLEQPGIKLELPRAQSSSPQRVEKAVLTISASGELFIGGEQVNQQKLSQHLRDMLPQMTEKNLIINADKEVNHGLVVEVMDIARRSGIQKLVISTKPD